MGPTAIKKALSQSRVGKASASFLQAMKRLDVGLIAFENAAPGQVVGGIAGSDAMEVGHPLLEPMVIGIDVLDVEST